VYSSIRLFKNEPGYLGILSTVVIFISYLVISKNHYLLNKFSIYVLPVLAIGLFDFLSARLPRRLLPAALTLVALLIFIGFAARGYQVLSYGMDIAKSRYTFVNRDLIDAKQRIYNEYKPKSVFAADYGLERSLLMRQFFKEVDWQPNKGKNVWAEYGYSPTRYPPSFDTYNYDVLLLAKDEVDPVDYSVNDRFIVYKNPFFSIYNKSASLVDFGLEWDEIPGGTLKREEYRSHIYYKRTDRQSAVVYFVNNGNHQALIITFEHLDSTGSNAAVLPTFLVNGSKVEPKCITAKGDHLRDLFIDCRTYGKVRVNRVELVQGTGESTVIRNVSIQ
jgi:hypothetical protein